MTEHILKFWESLWGKHLRFVVLVLFVALASLGTFLLAGWLTPEHMRLARAAERLAELLLTVVVLQLLTRFWIARQAEEAFFERLKVRDALIKSGIQDFYWFDKVPWEDLFQTATEVEVFAITARSLTGERIGLLRSYMRRPNTKLTLIIHDPDDSEAMARFDKSFGEKSGSRRDKILQNIQDLRTLATSEGVTSERLTIRLTKASPSYTYYRFDDRVLYVPYLIKPNIRIPDHIPAFLFSKGEVSEKFLSIDSKHIKETSRLDPSTPIDT